MPAKKPEVMTYTMQIRVTPTLAVELEKRATKRKIKTSKYIRNILDAHVNLNLG